MLGLPTETGEDMSGIVDLGYKVLGKAKNRGQVSISLSTFVPKPHTPFQWSRQINLVETLEKQDYFKSHLRNRHLSVKWHDARMSLLEGVISRGDERIGHLIEKAFRDGCRFDGWSDHFRFDLWEKAMSTLAIDPKTNSGSGMSQTLYPGILSTAEFGRIFLSENGINRRKAD